MVYKSTDRQRMFQDGSASLIIGKVRDQHLYTPCPPSDSSELCSGPLDDVGLNRVGPLRDGCFSVVNTAAQRHPDGLKRAHSTTDWEGLRVQGADWRSHSDCPPCTPPSTWVRGQPFTPLIHVCLLCPAFSRTLSSRSYSCVKVLSPEKFIAVFIITHSFKQRAHSQHW